MTNRMVERDLSICIIIYGIMALVQPALRPRRDV